MKNAAFQMLGLFAALLFVSMLTRESQAAPFDLDTSFGSGGKVLTALTPQRNYARRVRVQPDGKIVTLGHSWTTGFFPLFLRGSFITRHNRNGSVDTSFGANGVVITDRILNDFVILPDGKLLTTGYGNGFTLYRYNPDGTIDGGFGVNGTVSTQIGTDYAVGRKIVLQADGKIIVFGIVQSNPYRGNLAVIRYHNNGTVDNSFAANGILLIGIEVFAFYEIVVDDAIVEFFGDALIQPDGKLLVAVSNYYISLVRLNSNGTFDNTFGTNGIVQTAFSGYEDSPSGIALQADGKIVINGMCPYLGNIYTSGILRFNPNGTIDNTFGANGKIIIEEPNIDVKGLGSALAIQPNGNILTAGARDGVFALSRYKANGTLDTAFGTNGILTTPVGNNPGSDTIFSLAFQPDGKLVAAGSVKNPDGSYNLGLVRYLTDSVNRTLFDFDGDGRADISVFRPSNGTWYLNRSTQGFSATHFGLENDKLAPADYDGDGKTDIAVFRDGFWYWLNSSDNKFNAVHFGQAGDVPVPADYTGDGRAEIAVYRAGVWFTLDLTNNQFNSIQFGLSTDKPVAADYDGDGKADAAVYRNGIWYLQRSQLGFTAVQFGNSTDKPIVGDFDGDRKTDQAVYRGGTWYVLGSAQGSFAVQFGLADDVPTAADYDGDGKTDFAVFRPSNRIWYLQQSQSGFNAVVFGAANDKPVPNAFIP